MPNADELRRTPRGFAIYDEFRDDHGTPIRVQQSSGFGMRHVWIFSDPAEDGVAKPALHLSPEQVRRLRDALAAHLEHMPPPPRDDLYDGRMPLDDDDAP